MSQITRLGGTKTFFKRNAPPLSARTDAPEKPRKLEMVKKSQKVTNPIGYGCDRSRAAYDQWVWWGLGRGGAVRYRGATSDKVKSSMGCADGEFVIGGGGFDRASAVRTGA